MPRSTAATFNPASFDAQFATIIAQLKAQDEERWNYQRLEAEYRTGIQNKLDRIESAVNKTNGRVTALEEDMAMLKLRRRESDSSPWFHKWKKHGFWAAVWSGAGAIGHWIASHWKSG